MAGLGDIVGFERQFLEFPPKSFIVREVLEWDISPRDISPTVGAHKKSLGNIMSLDSGR